MSPRRLGLCLLVLAFAVAPAHAQDATGDEPAAAPQARSLDELLELVRQGSSAVRAENARREREFRERKDEQARLLREARAALAREEARSVAGEKAFAANEAALGELEQRLLERLGELGELFGVVRQVAGDTAGVVRSSLVSAQYPGRAEALAPLASSRDLPSLTELERLWFAIQREMTESGKVVRFPGPVVGADGREHQAEIVRVGTFNAVSDGRFLRFSPETQKLQELARQPAAQHREAARALAAAEQGSVAFPIDPSRGAILAALIQTPTLGERIAQGRAIGYLILVFGALGVALAVFQWLRLWLTDRAVRAQMQRDEPSPANPLGRILARYHESREVDVETLERKLDDAVLKEVPRLERFQTTIRALSVVAPLMGLLGTVTGMIDTFQSIVLFGTGDPKMMAGGISEALVTTALGLIVAIPLLLLHSFVSGRSRAITQVLDEQSAGLVAAHAEREAEAVAS